MSDNDDKKNIEQETIDWNEHAESWDSFPSARDYSKNVFALLSERLDLDGLTILDFGCGTGLLSQEMAQKAKQIIAIDSSEKMIEVLNKKNIVNVTTIIGELSDETIHQNPILKDKYDLIVASSVCAFLPNYEEVLSLIKSLLKPYGTYMQWDWLPNEKDPNLGFTEDMIRTHFNSVGLKVSSISIPFAISKHEEKMEVIMAVGNL